MRERKVAFSLSLLSFLFLLSKEMQATTRMKVTVNTVRGGNFWLKISFNVPVQIEVSELVQVLNAAKKTFFDFQRCPK